MNSDPPELVRQVEGSSATPMVSWSFPSSWPLDHAFLLMRHIRYWPLGFMLGSEVSNQLVPAAQLLVPANSTTFSFGPSAQLYGKSRGDLGRSGWTQSTSPGPDLRWRQWEPVEQLEPLVQLWEGQGDGSTSSEPPPGLVTLQTSEPAIPTFSQVLLVQRP